MDIQIAPCCEEHVTDEQFAELLMGATPAPVQEHLKACSGCAAEAERVADALGCFEQQSRLWAQRRAASWPTLATGHRPAFAWTTSRPQAWVAAALAIVVGLGVAISAHHGQMQEAVVEQSRGQSMTMASASSTLAPARTSGRGSVSPEKAGVMHVTPSKLKEDNELLSAIDGELRADSTPANLYGLDASSHTGPRASGRMTN
jgi:hypothetical protein